MFGICANLLPPRRGNRTPYYLFKLYFLWNMVWCQLVGIYIHRLDMVGSEINDAVTLGTEVIHNVAIATIPISSSARKHRKPWWNTACSEAIGYQRKAWNYFRKYPTMENYVAFKRAKSYARRERRRAQRASWIQYVSSISPSMPNKLLWNRIKRCMGFISWAAHLLYKRWKSDLLINEQNRKHYRD